MNASDFVDVIGIAGQAVSDDQLNVTVTVSQLGIFEAFFMSLIVFITAIFIHELGHLIALQRARPEEPIFGYIKLKKPFGVLLQSGLEHQYTELTPHERIKVYVWGILAGLIVVLLASMVHPFYLLVIGPYIVGCIGDFQKIWRNVQRVMAQEREKSRLQNSNNVNTTVAK